MAKWINTRTHIHTSSQAHIGKRRYDLCLTLDATKSSLHLNLIVNRGGVGMVVEEGTRSELKRSKHASQHRSDKTQAKFNHTYEFHLYIWACDLPLRSIIQVYIGCIVAAAALAP